MILVSVVVGRRPEDERRGEEGGINRMKREEQMMKGLGYGGDRCGIDDRLGLRFDIIRMSMI